MIEVWRELPDAFRFPEPDEPITLWRATTVGRQVTGMTCRLESGDAHEAVLEAATRGTDALVDLIDRHTSSPVDSPLLSAAGDIRLAQLFARHSQPGKTLYQLSVPAHNLVRDPHNIGTPGWPQDSEVFVVGDIQPHDIIAHKANNTDPRASELAYTRSGRLYIATTPQEALALPAASTPNPLGVWQLAAPACN